MRNKKNKIIGILVTIVFVITISLVFIVINTGNDSAITEGKEFNNSNNSVTFNCGYFKEYVHITLQMEKNENIEDGLEYEIIDANNEVIYKDKLTDQNRVRKVYNGEKGEWKIKFNFNNEKEKAMIKYNIEINSTEE